MDRRPISGSSTKARTCNCLRSASCKSSSPVFTNPPARKEVDDAGGRRANVALADHVLGKLYGDLGVIDLALGAVLLRGGVADLRLKFGQIGFGPGQPVGRGGDFHLRGGALLLKP